MNDKQFDELLSSIQDMGRHMRGEAVDGARVRDFPAPEPKAIRERSGVTQHRAEIASQTNGAACGKRSLPP